MSSKTKTENLQLNQWELDDVFQMSDFNQDNAKIDAAMGEALGNVSGALEELHAPGISAVKLTEIILSTKQSFVDVTLSDFVAEKKYFQYIILCPLDTQLTINGSLPQYKYSEPDGNWIATSDIIKSRRGVFTLYVDDIMSNTLTYLRACADGKVYRMGIYAMDLNTLRLTCDSIVYRPYPAGSRMVLLGLKFGE